MIFQGIFELVYSLSRLLAVLCEALDFASTLHASCHLHSAVHLLRDLGQRGHVLRRVVPKVKVLVLRQFLLVAILVAFQIGTVLRLRSILLALIFSVVPK